MKVEFFKRWGTRRGIDKLSYEQAKRYHEKEKSYVAVFSDEKPRFIVGVYFDKIAYYCTVKYLNENLKTARLDGYIFHNHKLFLRNVQVSYHDESEIRGISYLYETDGRYRKRIDYKDFKNEVEYGTCDVSNHFREMIRFGNYDSILSEEARRMLREGKEESQESDGKSET
jgi:hypothetical protein